MLFYYNIMFSKHWHMLTMMLQEAYGDESNLYDNVLLGCYVHTSVNDIRNELIKTNQYYDGKLIVYQSEPLTKNHWWKTEQIVENIKDADEIWDYDLENIQILQSYGLKAKFRPPTYVSCLANIYSQPEPDIDVLFYGTLTPYRYETINNVIGNAEIQENHINTILNFKFVFLYNVMDHLLEEMIGRSKIILNINPYEGECRQQQTRIFYPLINNKCVLSQKSSINYYDNLITEYTDWKDLYQKMIHLLENDRWKDYTYNNGYKAQSLKMRNKVEEILSYDR